MVLLLAAAVAVGIFFSRNAIVEGEVVSTDVEELDLRGSESLDVEYILRLQSLKRLDIRGIDVTDDVLCAMLRTPPISRSPICPRIGKTCAGSPRCAR